MPLRRHTRLSPQALVRGAVAVLALGVVAVGCASADGGGESIGEQSSAITPISGCDYSFARPAPSSLVSMGYKFVARYLSGDPGGGKDITASEASSLTGAGLDITLVWETTGTDATDGYNQGVSDAQGAAAEAATVGAPATRPIYFAIDFDAGASDASSINAYFQGVASVIGLSRTGVYGGYYIVNELFNEGLITFGWQTYAWSGGAWDARAQVRQTQNGVDNDELDADEGMVADYGQWGPGAPTGAADYAAAFVSQSFPLATSPLPMVEGETIPSYIELKNVGTKTWDSSTHLATTQPRDRTSVFADSSWLAPDRPAGVTGTVAPGATYKFQFNLHAPDKVGTYDEFFGVVEDGVVWFSDPGQGGPADNDLEVQVVVTVPDGGLVVTSDAGADDAGVATDAGGTVDAVAPSVDAGEADAGRHDAGHHDAGKSGESAKDAGGDVDTGDTEGAVGSTGGCRVGTGEAPPFASLGLLGLVLAVRRRRARAA